MGILITRARSGASKRTIVLLGLVAVLGLLAATLALATNVQGFEIDAGEGVFTATGDNDEAYYSGTEGGDDWAQGGTQKGVFLGVPTTAPAPAGAGEIVATDCYGSDVYLKAGVSGAATFICDGHSSNKFTEPENNVVSPSGKTNDDIWPIKPGNNTPKNEFTHAYSLFTLGDSACDNDGLDNNLFLNLAGNRSNAEGTAFWGFELNQTPPEGFDLLVANGGDQFALDFNRTVGDLLISFTMLSGDNVLELYEVTVVGPQGGTDTFTETLGTCGDPQPLAGESELSINQGDYTNDPKNKVDGATLAPDWNIPVGDPTPKVKDGGDGGGNTFRLANGTNDVTAGEYTLVAEREFIEGVVDLEAFGIETKCFSSLIFTSRSSQVLEGADLKDIGGGYVYLCGADIQIEDDGTNWVNAEGDPGSSHTFTVTVNQVIAGSTLPVIDGTIVTITFPDGTPGTVDASDCDTIGTFGGTCEVTVDSDVTGIYTVHAAADVGILGDSIHVETDGTGDNSDDATKEWVDAQISIEASDTNFVNATDSSHTFTVTVEKDLGDGNGFVAAAGETVTASETGIGSLQGTGTCETGVTDSSGQCTIVVDSSATGQSEVDASATVTIVGYDTVNIDVATDGYGANTVDNIKTWVDAQISIETSDTNFVNATDSSHTFTVTVEKDLGDGNGFVAAAGETVTASETGIGSLQGTGTCETGVTDSSGQCTIVVDSSATGQSEVDASAALTVDGVLINVATDGYGANTVDNIKTWVDAQISIETSDTNFVNATDSSHTFTVTVEKDLGDGNGFVAAAGETVTASETGIGSLQGTGTCETGVTDSSGQCTIVVDSSATGQSEVDASAALTVDGVLINVATDGYGANTVDNIKTWVDAQISIETSDTNFVNATDSSHTFTVTVEKDLGDGNGFVAAAGETVTASETGIGSLQGTGTCETGVTDSSGQCTIVVDSSATGQSEVDASAALTVDGVLINVATDGYGANTVDNIKTWVDAQISIETSDTNFVNATDSSHTFTVTVEKDLGDGNGFVAAAGETVTASETGIGSLQGTGTCETGVTDSSGQCTIVVDSSATGQSEVDASAALTVDGVLINVATDGYGANTVDNIKTWVDAQISIETSDTNFVNATDSSHTFTVTVEKDLGDGNGFVAAAGETVTASETGIGSLQGTGTCETGVTDSSGQCTIVVDSSATGQSEVDASAALTVDGVLINVATDGYGANTVDNIKTWVDAQISIETSDTNFVNATDSSHTFTVTVEKDLGDGNGFVAAAGETVTASETGIGSLQGTGTCETGVTDSSGQCTIVVDSSATGQSEVDASAALTVDGVLINVATDGYGANTVDNIKTWVDAQISIETSDTNFVNATDSSHTFTVTVEKDLGDGNGFVAAAGETVTASETGIGSLQGTGTCETGVTDSSGQCTIVVDSSATGQSEVDASAALTVDGVLINVATDGYGANTVDNIKTWVDAQISIETSDTNFVNATDSSHTFTVTVEKDLGDGNGFVAAAGETVTASETGIGSLQGTGTCETGVTDSSGQCTIVVDSSATGQSEVDASAALTVDGVLINVATDGYGANTVDNIKTWVDAQITIVTSDTNNINEAHTFYVTVEKDLGDGGGWIAASGVIVTPVETGVGAITSENCTAGTDSSGQCTITVNSSTAGVSEVNASGTVSIDGVNILVATDGYGAHDISNEKTWVDGSLVWHKVDELGLPLAGATFEVCQTHTLNTSTDTYDAITSICFSVTDDPPDNVGLDEDPADGEFLITGLELGSYTVRETAAPAGYYINNPFAVDAPNMTLAVPDVEIAEAFVNSPPPEGCTPGWWKNNGLTAWDEWTDPLAQDVADAVFAEWGITVDGTTETLFRNAFNLTVGLLASFGWDDDITLLEAVEAGGGDFIALGRHGVSALLNSLSVLYQYDASSVLQDMNAAYSDGLPFDDQALLDAYATANERDHSSCPIGTTPTAP